MGHSFCSHAKHKVEHITEEHKKMDDAYREVCIMFNESSRTTEPSEFFSQFAQFISEWKVSDSDCSIREILGGMYCQ